LHTENIEAYDLSRAVCFGNGIGNGALSAMKRFFFDLAGDLPARDVLGHQCSSKKEAKLHASFIAHRIGTEKPCFAKPGNRISVRDEAGAALFDVPIATTVRNL
jgi:hypothetical protein